MGTASSLVQNFNIYGNGNVFRPTADQVSTAVPTLSLQPGVLNPGGLAWRRINPDVDPTAPGALIQMTTDDIPTASLTCTENASGLVPVNAMYMMLKKEELVVVTDHAIDQMHKLEYAMELSRAYLNEKSILPQSTSFDSYVIRVDCYVGASALQAARNFVRGAPLITRSRMVAYMTAIQNAFEILSDWESDIREAMNLIPSTTPYGATTCDMQSVIKFLDENLPENSLVRLYPQQAADSIARRNGGIRWKDEVTGDVPSLATNTVAAATLGVINNTVPLGEKSDVTSEAMSLVTVVKPDLVTSMRPVSSSVFATTVSPKTYNIRAQPVMEALWLRTAAAGVDMVVGWWSEEHAATHYTVIRPGTKVINLQQTGSMLITVDLVDKDYRTVHFNPDGQTVILLLLQSKIPFEQLTSPTELIGVAQVASVVLSASDSSTEGSAIINNTNLSYLFEREILRGPDTEVNTYLLCGFRTDSQPTKENMPWYDAWDAKTTLTPLTTGEVTLNGAAVPFVTPMSLIGAYTPEAMQGALPNDAGILLAERAMNLAEAIKLEDDSMADEASPFSAPIQGVLAIQQHEPGEGVKAWLGPFDILRKAARAIQVFLGNPKSVLMQGVPVVSDPNVWIAMVQGIRDGIRNKSLSVGVRTALDNLNAVQSVRTWKSDFLTKVEKYYPPSSE
ncbi:mu B [Mahlapitsi orthoreovirus]|uniref:Mu B n=1 Tax=Mahlapitsi orthoreovirus TaxID=2170064 RepID=A0A3G1HJT8_9REOV|nr:mu B [Mahlapitsi orthoreovirus]AMU04175.1 mu B [Mahlapitsi orthoreovirus]